jgi:hypothetical protein
MNIAALFANTQHAAEQNAASYRQDARSARAAADLAIARGDRKAADRYSARAARLMRWAEDSEDSAADFRHLGRRLEVIP